MIMKCFFLCLGVLVNATLFSSPSSFAALSNLYLSNTGLDHKNTDASPLKISYWSDGFYNNDINDDTLEFGEDNTRSEAGLKQESRIAANSTLTLKPVSYRKEPDRIHVDLTFRGSYFIEGGILAESGPNYLSSGFGISLAFYNLAFSKFISGHVGLELNTQSYLFNSQIQNQIGATGIQTGADRSLSYSHTQVKFGSPVFIRLNNRNWKFSPIVEGGMFLGNKDMNRYYDNGSISQVSSWTTEPHLSVGLVFNFSSSHFIGFNWRSYHGFGFIGEIRF